MNYSDVFFDLDHTLWDFEQNSQQTLLDIYQKYELSDKAAIRFEDLIAAFRKTTKYLWKQHNLGLVDKEKIRQLRFKLIFEELQKTSNETFLLELEDHYHYYCPRGGKLLPFALQTLKYLKEKGYRLHILTNGFAESQRLKLEHAGILDYFEHITTSECTGYTKPHHQIFDHALEVSKASAPQSIMIGDSFDADILGARAMGMKTIFYNPHQQVPTHSVATHDIRCLSEIMHYL